MKFKKILLSLGLILSFSLKVSAVSTKKIDDFKKMESTVLSVITSKNSLLTKQGYTLSNQPNLDLNFPESYLAPFFGQLEFLFMEIDDYKKMELYIDLERNGKIVTANCFSIFDKETFTKVLITKCEIDGHYSIENKNQTVPDVVFNSLESFYDFK